MRALAGIRVGQADGLHGTEAERVPPALGHHLDGEAALEIGGVAFPVLEFGLFRREQRVDEGLVLRLVHRAVDVVGAGSGRAGLVVAALEPGDVEIDGFAIDDGRDRIEEGERILAGQGADGFRQRRRCQRTGRDDRVGPVFGGQAGDLPTLDPDERFGRDRGSDGVGKAVPVDGEGAARRYLVGIGGGKDDRRQTPHLFVQQADRRGPGVVGPERIRADELGEPVGPVNLGRPLRPHLVQDRRDPGACDLPSRFRAGQTAADDMNGRHSFAAARALSRFTSADRVCMPVSRIPSESRCETVL